MDNQKQPHTAESHAASPWRAEHWRCHAATTILTDDASTFNGKRVVAEFETEDEARLGAAAPDLLYAATAAEAILARGRWIEGSTDPEAVALSMLRAAIAKASGAP